MYIKITFLYYKPLKSTFPSTQALALPNATSHFCLSWGDGALRYMCCCPGITKSSRVLSILLTVSIIRDLIIYENEYLSNI